MQNGGRTAQDIAGSPHITELGAKGPFSTYLQTGKGIVDHGDFHQKKVLHQFIGLFVVFIFFHTTFS